MTLTQTATLTRRTILGFVIFVFLSLTTWFGYQVWHNYYLANLPPVEEKPEMKFGQLPEIIFPASTISASNYSYSLDTTTGDFPQTPKILKVYFIPKAIVSLTSPEKAKQLAANLGFKVEPQPLTSTDYKFSNGAAGELLIDITTGNFSFSKEATLSGILTNEKQPLTKIDSFPSQDQIIQSFKQYLKKKSLLTAELENGKGVVSFNNTGSDTVLVSIWPIPINELPIVTASFSQSNVAAIMTKYTDENYKYSQMAYSSWPIDQTTFSTYPLKTPAQALADLKIGKGYISIEPGKAQVSISSVSLAYYETMEYTPYLQPVFVFEGPNFAALVPAVLTGN